MRNCPPRTFPSIRSGLSAPWLSLDMLTPWPSGLSGLGGGGVADGSGGPPPPSFPSDVMGAEYRCCSAHRIDRCRRSGEGAVDLHRRRFDEIEVSSSISRSCNGDCG